MNQKTIAIVVIAVVAVAVIGVAAYWFYGGIGTGEPEPTPTPTPKPTGIEGATSLQFSVNVTGGASAGTYKYWAKNIGTDDMMIRVEIPLGEASFIYIVNGAQDKAWANEGSGWTDLSATFSDQWELWHATYEAYTSKLSTWTSGDYTYTDTDGSTFKIYGITVNPSLADSLFQAE